MQVTNGGVVLDQAETARSILSHLGSKDSWCVITVSPADESEASSASVAAQEIARNGTDQAMADDVSTASSSGNRGVELGSKSLTEREVPRGPEPQAGGVVDGPHGFSVVRVQRTSAASLSLPFDPQTWAMAFSDQLKRTPR
jgi:Tfp pilus assembly major pilin PilA